MEKKTAIVTGGGKGIGKEIALHLSENGYNIVVNYSKTFDESLKTQIEANNVQCEAFKADVSKFEETKALCDFAIEKFGKVDLLVNNAGITKDNLLLRMTTEEFMEVININLIGTFNMIRNTVPYMMKKKKGAIVNISSVVGLLGNAGQSNYAASKAGILGLTKTVAREYGSKNITCNAIAPGFIKTDMTEGLSDKVREMMLLNIPVKRLGESLDVAKAVLFLAENPYITGQTLNVDGGFAM